MGRSTASERKNKQLIKVEGDGVVIPQIPVKSEQVCLDHFKLLRVIGRGSYAKVFQVEYKPTSKIYAMKVIKKEIITDEEVRPLSQLQNIDDFHPLLLLILKLLPRMLSLLFFRLYFAFIIRSYFLFRILIGFKPRSMSLKLQVIILSWWAFTPVSKLQAGKSNFT